MDDEFLLAIEQIGEEKGISKEKVVESIEAALAAAYRKDYLSKDETVRIKFTLGKGITEVYRQQTVVEGEPRNASELSLDQAKALKNDATIGEVIETPLPLPDAGFGRIAAQTAKQVILQRLREAERDVSYEEFKAKEGSLITGTVQRFEGPNATIDLGRLTATLFAGEMIPGERLRPGMRVRLFVTGVEMGVKGPEISVSRTHPEMVAYLFHEEVPEIGAGSVLIKKIAREAGSRTKIAVASTSPQVDPIGACVGQRGTRVQTVMSEIGGEKIDIILFHENLEEFIKNALAPAKVVRIELNRETYSAKVYVHAEQLSLAIGKSGQNVRLAARLTGIKLDIHEEGKEVAEAHAVPHEESDLTATSQTEPPPGEPASLAKLGLSAKLTERLSAAGFTTKKALKEASDETLMQIEGIGDKTLRKIRNMLTEK